MRHSAGELAYGFHLHRLAQLSLETDALGDVESVAVDHVVARRRVERPVKDPLTGLHLEAELLRAALEAVPGHGQGVVRQDRSAAVRAQALGDGGGRIVQAADRPVAGDLDDRVRVEARDRRQFHHGRLGLLPLVPLLLQRLVLGAMELDLELLAVRDVLDHPDAERGLASAVRDRGEAQLAPDQSAVLAVVARLAAIVAAPPFDQVAEPAAVLPTVLRVCQIPEHSVLQLIAAVAEHLVQGGVPADQTSLRVDQRDADHGRLKHGPEALLARAQSLLGALVLRDLLLQVAGTLDHPGLEGAIELAQLLPGEL